ncbi:MAG: hypothetical protein NTW16_17325, partial [Bacteroidetes bacterium]|nr:hypothetical protein [Bacteroidota bacterium]
MKEIIQLSRMNGNKKFQIVLSLMVWAFSMAFLSTGVLAQDCTVNSGVEDTLCVNRRLFLDGGSSPDYTGNGNVHWTQLHGPSVHILDPYNLQTEVTGYVANTEYWFMISAKCADGVITTDSVWYYFKPITMSHAGPDLTGCPGLNTLTLQGNVPIPPEQGEWQIVGPSNGVTINDPNSYNSTLSLASGSCGATTLRWTITGTNSCYDYDDMVVYNIGGVTPVDAGARINLGGCYSSTTSATLGASQGGCGISGQSGVWTFISGPTIPVFGNRFSNTSSLSNLVEGTYIVLWSVSGPCANGTDYDTIVVAKALGSVTGASAGAAQVFCDTRLDFVLTGNSPIFAGDSGLWVQTGGHAGVTIADPKSAITGVTITNPTGTYTFSYTFRNSITGCSSSASTTITYNINPSLELYADPYLPCADSIATITYSIPTGNGSLEWRILSGPTNWFYTSFPTVWTAGTSGGEQKIYHLSGAGTYVISMRVVPGYGNICTSVSQDVSVTTSTEPSIANAGTNVILACNKDTAFLSGSNARPIGTWTVRPGAPSVPVFSDIHDRFATVTNLVAGLYRVRWVISGGPECPTEQDDMRIILADHTPSQADAGPDSTICHHFPLKMQGNLPG